MSNSLSSLFRQTISYCPECYKKVPAFIFLTDSGALMEKHCSEHGRFEALVERDVNFYLQAINSPASTIYPGYFIDVTKKCNLKCAHCYYPVENKGVDISKEAIYQDALVHRGAAPFILTGGEPTLRDDLAELITGLQGIGPVELLTNGTGLNESTMEQLSPLLVRDGMASINLSIHPEINTDNIRVLELCRSMGIKLESVLFVVERPEEMDRIIDLCIEYPDVICATRIKAATRVWNDQSSENKLFVSDLLKYISDPAQWGAKVTWWRHNKVSFVTTELNGIYHMLVSWYDVGNVDLLDISCPPYYQAQTGETLNILTAMLVNEGMQKGWLNGNRRKDK